MANEYKDPSSLLDVAAADGYVAICFESKNEARKFAMRLRRILSVAERALTAGNPNPKYTYADTWAPVLVRLEETRVEIINSEHPVGKTHIPTFKIERSPS